MGFLSFFNKKPPQERAGATRQAKSPRQSVNKFKSERGTTDNTEDEQVVSEKKRARRRLIGAVVMVLAVVVGVPMLLDSEPKLINKNIAIQISSKDSSSILVAGATGEGEGASSKMDSDQAEQIAESKIDAISTPNVSEKNEISIKSEASKEVVKEVVKSTSSDMRSIQAAESAKALAILNGTESSGDFSGDNGLERKGIGHKLSKSSESLEKSTGRFVIQVGAFATQEKVDELRRKLNSAGIKSFTQKVATSSGDKIRVRVGPFLDKSSADKVKAQLQKLGLNATLIAL